MQDSNHATSYSILAQNLNLWIMVIIFQICTKEKQLCSLVVQRKQTLCHLPTDSTSNFNLGEKRRARGYKLNLTTLFSLLCWFRWYMECPFSPLNILFPEYSIHHWTVRPPLTFKVLHPKLSISSIRAVKMAFSAFLDFTTTPPSPSLSEGSFKSLCTVV